MRDFLLRALVLFGCTTALLTELLGRFHGLRPVPLAVGWIVVALAAIAFLWFLRPKFVRFAMKPLEACIAAALALIVALTGLTAWLSPPNTYDAMGYHLPRVVYWAQNGSVEFFPTSYLNQIDFPPLAEYFMLHTYVLSGGDHFVNLVSWAAFAASILGVSAIASALGLGSRGQAWAALFCATLTNSVLQASGAKNDSLVGFWLVCVVYFAARREGPFLGLSLGLALLTKGTAYVFAPALVCGMFLWHRVRGRHLERLTIAAWLIGGVLVLNAPHYLRNLQLNGSPLGFDSPFGDGRDRFRNEPLGWKPTVSNVLLNISDQLGSGSTGRSLKVYETVLRLHKLLGINPSDPVNALRMSRYTPPQNTRHEANANNRWHLLLLCCAAFWGFWVAWRRHEWRWSIYAASLFGAFLLFCFYIRWQPYAARLELPLFVLGSPLAGFLLGGMRPAIFPILAGLLLLDTARLPVLQNWTRPLRGPNNLFVTSRENNYFMDMLVMNEREMYLRSVELTAESGCGLVGIDNSVNQLEYPFQALLRERNPGVQFIHTGVDNASTRYQPRPARRPCAVLCPDCGGSQERIEMYRAFGPPIEIGSFLLFLPSRVNLRLGPTLPIV